MINMNSMTEQDYKTIETMEKFGGSFVKTLAELCRRADSANFTKIKETWSDYFDKYEHFYD